MSAEYETPEGWEQHGPMSKAPGYLDAFRTPDHTAFVDIVEYKPHMDAAYLVEYRLANGDRPETYCEESVDCDDETEAWNAAVRLMNDADEPFSGGSHE